MKALKGIVGIVSMALLSLVLVTASQLTGRATTSAASLYDCSWGSDGATTTLYNVRGDSLNGGFAGFSNPGWTSQGVIETIDDTVDASGETITVTANVSYSSISNGRRTGAIAATATFTGLIALDGSESEGVTITDLNGAVIAFVLPEPIVRGGLYISH